MLALDGGSGGQLHAPAALPPRVIAHNAHWLGSWLGPEPVTTTSNDTLAPQPMAYITIVTELCLHFEHMEQY
jgi:hypothetical protein